MNNEPHQNLWVYPFGILKKLGNSKPLSVQLFLSVQFFNVMLMHIPYLTAFPRHGCPNHCKVCSFWSECHKITVKQNTKWVSPPTARPVWEPNAWYIRQFWDERLKIDTPYSVTAPWVSQVCNCRQLFSECVKFIVKYKAKWVQYPTARPLMGAKCVIHSYILKWASQNWHTLQRLRAMGVPSV